MVLSSHPRFSHTLTPPALGSLILLASLVTPVQAQRARPKSAQPFAQTLVEKTLAAHPETDEIGIAVQSSTACTVVASSDRSDVGETCEEDDRMPIKTGRPSVGKEDGEFDVAVPLRDKTGTPVGAVSIRFKKAAAQSNASVTNEATGIAKEMARQIPSKTALLAQ
jgi:hypothetical protein